MCYRVATSILIVSRGEAQGYLGGSESYSYGNGSPDPTVGKHDMWHDHGPGIDVVPEIVYSVRSKLMIDV